MGESSDSADRLPAGDSKAGPGARLDLKGLGETDGRR